MAELVLELFSEEIPARMQLPMAEKLKSAMEDRLKAENLYFTDIKTAVTPRRLVLKADGLSLTQEDTVVEKRGPRTDAPEAAIEGFLRSTGMELEQLTKLKTDKGEFYFAIQKQKGVPTKEVLKDAVEDIIPSLSWPKSMRWNDYKTRWVRPLKNICCVFGGESLPIQFGHITANNKSEGHRFLSEGQFAVEDFNDYKKELENRFVILETEKRKEIIIEGARAKATELGLTLIEDDNLLTEVAGLVEWPEVLLGSIDPEFMTLPEEVLISSIKTHQKYFCLRNKEGKLASHFIVISNMKANDESGIVAGNERVLRARLADAKFFWEQDSKIPLDERKEALERVIFHAEIGTVAQKVQRIQAVAKFLAVWVPHANLDLVERAALLSKSDLVTEMVGEFPDLQGTMGYYYALNDRNEKEVAEAIKEHYSPLGPSDECPKAPVSIAVAMADKIDTLTGLFTIDEKPTGSKDPYALRRAALGIIRLIIENQLSIPLKILIEHSLKQYPKAVFKQEEVIEKETGKGDKKKIKEITKTKKVKPADVTADLLLFFSDRLKALLKGENVRHDLIAAVFDSGDEDDILRVVKRVASLDSFLKTDDGQNLLAAYKRATNIVTIEEKKDETSYSGSISKGLLETEEEQKLYEILNEIKPNITKSLKENDFAGAMGLLSELRSPIDAFFDKVVVNCDKQDLRKNRLKLLSSLREILDNIADFSLIEG